MISKSVMTLVNQVDNLHKLSYSIIIGGLVEHHLCKQLSDHVFNGLSKFSPSNCLVQH